MVRGYLSRKQFAKRVLYDGQKFRRHKIQAVVRGYLSRKQFAKRVLSCADFGILEALKSLTMTFKSKKDSKNMARLSKLMPGLTKKMVIFVVAHVMYVHEDTGEENEEFKKLFMKDRRRMHVVLERMIQEGFRSHCYVRKL